VGIDYPGVDGQGDPIYYIYGMDSDNDPCAGIYPLQPTETITFNYDRRAAAEYAMAHAYRNSVPEGTYPVSISQVTSRLDDTTIPAGESIRVPNPFGDVPYAYFTYPEQVTGVEGSTGSAMFTSQAIWMGGMPMTLDVDENELCDSDIPAVTATTGWRYCFDSQLASYGWRSHDPLVAYYASQFNTVLPNDGRLILEVSFGTTQQITKLNEIGGNLVLEGLPLLEVFENKRLFYNEYISLSPDIVPLNSPRIFFDGILGVETGDYVHINPNRLSGHGFLVVGWGEITSCLDALNSIWTFDIPNTRTLYQSVADAQRTGAIYVVPYVVDFSGGISDGQLQRPRPRPFYCAEYSDGNFFGLESNYLFYKFPESSGQLSYSNLFVPIDWSWQQ
jgi:hypothetical protein